MQPSRPAVPDCYNREMARNNNSNRARGGLLALFAVATTACAPDLALQSPHGEFDVQLQLDADGRISYSMRAGGNAILAVSKLGIDIDGRDDFDAGWRFDSVERKTVDQEWEQPWGEQRVVVDRHNEMSVAFVNSQSDRLAFRARAFDDGIGFRYELQMDDAGPVRIVDELTEFALADSGTALWQPGNDKLRYEVLYRRTPVVDIGNAHTPLTVGLDNGYHLALHEAALVDYAAFTLERTAERRLQTRLRAGPDGYAVEAAAAFVTPWRTVSISRTAAGLLDSTLTLNLNEPNALGDVSWIQPGKYAGIWWAMHLGQKTWAAGPDHGATTDAVREVIDFAAQSGFAGVLVEGWNRGWEGGGFDYTTPYDDFDIEAVTAYAAERGVYLIGHHETYGDVPGYERQLEAALDWYRDKGVPQIKTGYVADAGELRMATATGEIVETWHDGQLAVRHHARVIREAAERRIAINTHEPVKDTGLRRTYPNWLTREGSRGQEFAIWGETPNPPEHTVMLAYTRMLAGPMDFTPGMFNLHPKGPESPRRIQTTLAKQLALYVVLYSPMQMVPDLPEHYAARPRAFRFIVDVATDWERSVALAGELGRFVVVARQARGSGDWYIGAITDGLARTVAVSLSFLEEGQDYVAEIYRDGDDAHWDDNPYALTVDTKTVSRDDTLELKLAAGGGAAIKLRPDNKAKQQ